MKIHLNVQNVFKNVGETYLARDKIRLNSCGFILIRRIAIN